MPLYATEKGMNKAIREASTVYIRISEQIDPLYHIKISKKEALKLIERREVSVSLARKFQATEYIAYVEPG